MNNLSISPKSVNIVRLLTIVTFNIFQGLNFSANQQVFINF